MGHYDAVAATIAARVEQVADLSRYVLDAGSGTGHHLARLTARLPGSVIGLGLDISKAAVQRAAQRWPTTAFAVADLWTEWPLHDVAADLVISIFAPKNFPEMARVLRPGGWLVVAYPGPEHLAELRDRFGLLRQNKKTSGRSADMAAPFVGLLGTVIGILNAFQQIATQKTSGIGAVAGGISEALVTTAFGLLVAIPAVMAFNYFTGRVEAFDVEMDNSSSELIDYFIKQSKR